MHAARWSEARNVLCVRLDSLGDVLMTTPAIRALKRGRPDRRVTLLTSPAGEAVARLVPDIDDVMVYESPWMKATARREDSAADQAMITALRERNFDAAAIFTVYSQNPLPAAMLAYLADIPLRLAYCRENPYQLLTDWVRESEPEQGVRHEVRRLLDLVAQVGCHVADERLGLQVPPRARSRVRSLLRTLDLEARRWIAVHPGASAASRRYPPEQYAQAIRELTVRHDLRIVLTGSPDEVELVESIRELAGVPTHSLAGQLRLPELCALIGSAPLLLSNNTGPAHVAAALGTPVVNLYALTNPQHTPWQVPSRVLNHAVPCANCYRSVCPEGHHQCLRGVSAGSVVRAVLELLEETSPEGVGVAGTPQLIP